MKLTGVSVTSGASNKKFAITTDNAGKTPTEGGAVQTLAAVDDVGTWTLTDTEADTGYYIYGSSSKARIKHIELIYE